jgi:hypothetical protein
VQSFQNCLWSFWLARQTMDAVDEAGDVGIGDNGCGEAVSMF